MGTDCLEAFLVGEPSLRVSKELLALAEGFREYPGNPGRNSGFEAPMLNRRSEACHGRWRALVLEGAPAGLRQTRAQRCRVHKTTNILNKLPKHLQPEANSDLYQIWMAATRADAQAAFDAFFSTNEPKHSKAAECLAKDRKAKGRQEIDA